MAQTLNFAIQVDQSQLPSAIQQLQGGINTQLQAGALQLGTMANGLTATMAGMNALGVTPSSMGFAHAMAPGQVNYSLGRQPFMDRTASILDFMNSAGGAVKARASSIVASMDSSKIAPSINNDSRWWGVAKAAAGVTLGIGAMALGGWAAGGITAGLALKGVGGFAASSIGYGLAGAGADWVGNKAGWQTKQFTPEQLQKMTIERRGYADIAGAFMALGPQKYLPKMGTELDTTANIAFGKSISDAFLARQDFSVISRAAAKNPGYLTDVLSSLATTDRIGYSKYIAPLHKYAGANAAAAPIEILKPAVSYFNAMELQAQAAGYGSVSSLQYKRLHAYLAQGQMSDPTYKGPNRFQLMGESMGTGLRMGKEFGSKFVNSLRDRVTRDLGLSPEERRWMGGDQGVAGQYASVVMREMATFGSSTNLAYAAQYASNASGGKLAGNIYDMNTQAAGVFTDPRQYVKFRLNYKDIVRSAGPTDALYRRNQVMIAREMMAQSGGAFENEHDALRMMYEGQGMDAEQARVQAGVVLGVGRHVAIKGGPGKKVRLTDVYSGQSLETVVAGIATKKDISTEAAREIAGKQIFSGDTWQKDLAWSDADVAGFAAFQKGAGDPGGKYAKKLAQLKKMKINPNDISGAKTGNEARQIILQHQINQTFMNDKFVEAGGVSGISYLTKLAKLGGSTLETVQALNAQIRAAKPENKFELQKQLATVLQNTGDKDLAGALDVLSEANMSGISRDTIAGYAKANMTVLGADGKGKPGEYDIDVAEKDWNAGLEQMNKSMKEFIKIMKQKGK